MIYNFYKTERFQRFTATHSPSNSDVVRTQSWKTLYLRSIEKLPCLGPSHSSLEDLRANSAFRPLLPSRDALLIFQTSGFCWSWLYISRWFYRTWYLRVKAASFFINWQRDSTEAKFLKFQKCITWCAGIINKRKGLIMKKGCVWGMNSESTASIFTVIFNFFFKIIFWAICDFYFSVLKAFRDQHKNGWLKC